MGWNVIPGVVLAKASQHRRNEMRSKQCPPLSRQLAADRQRREGRDVRLRKYEEKELKHEQSPPLHRVPWKLLVIPQEAGKSVEEMVSKGNEQAMRKSKEKHGQSPPLHRVPRGDYLSSRERRGKVLSGRGREKSKA